MKIQFYFSLEELTPYDVMLPISFGDRVDGVADTLSFEFLANEDLLTTYKKYQKCKLLISDDDDTLIKEFRMCITDINRDLNTTAYENNAPKYTYTLTISEPSVLTQKSNRTDIAITPYMYGKLNGKYPYETLFDAYLKVCSCHNLNARNEPIYNNYIIEEADELNNEVYLNSPLNLDKSRIKGTVTIPSTLTNTRINGNLRFIADESNPIPLGNDLYYCEDTISYPLTNNLILPIKKDVPLFNMTTEETETFTLVCDDKTFYFEEYPSVDISSYINTSNITFRDNTYYIPSGETSIDQQWFPIEINLSVYTSQEFVIGNLYDELHLVLSYNSQGNKINVSYTSEENKKYSNLSLQYSLKISKFNAGGEKIYNSLSNVACPTITYQDLSTFSQLQDLFGRVGMIPYLTFDDEGRCYLDAYYIQGSFEGNNPTTLEYFSTDEACKLDDTHSTTISTQVKNMVCDNDTITYPSRYEEVLRKNSYGATVYYSFGDEFYNFEQFQSGIINNPDYIENSNSLGEITMAVPDNYNASAKKIEGANTYSVTLPSNIENILYIYKIEDASNSQNPNRIKLSKLFDNALRQYSIKNVLEYSEYSKLPDTQKRYFSYFVRGENRLNQIVSLLASISELNQDYPWDKDDLYNAVRKCRLCIIYKPMINSEYTYYNYDNLSSKTTEYINTPYKLVSDKQLASILGYEFNKRDSTNISFKVVTTNPNELLHYAGERVFLKEHKLFNDWNLLSDTFYGKEFISDEHGDSFDTELELNNFYDDIISQSDAREWFEKNGYNVWCYVGEDVYTINQLSNKWEKYLGELCVITKMDVSIDNNIIEITYELSNKIANNSVYSNYSDNIRVSDNLSTSNLVTRNVIINKSFLLNCHTKTTNSNQVNLYPSSDHELDNKPYLNGYDSLLYSNGMLKLGFNDGYSSQSGYGQSLSNVTKLKNLSANIVYNSLLTQFGDWNEQSGTVVYSRKLEDMSQIVAEFATGKSATFSFNQSTGILTGNGLVEIDKKYAGIINGKNDIMFPDVAQIINYLVQEGNHYFRYIIRTHGTSGYKMHFEHSTSSNFSNYDTVNIWGISRNFFISSYHLYIKDGVTSSVGINVENGTISEAILNSNALSIKSCNLLSYTFSFPNSCLGSSAFDYKDGKFSYVKPLFYNRSGDISNLHSISSLEENISLFKFKNILRDYGFSDLNIDIREKINVIIEYIVLPSNTFDFYTKYQYWNTEKNNVVLYPNRNNTGVNAEEKTLTIIELNTNVDFLNDTILDTSDLSSYVFKLKLISKGATIGDYIKDKTIASIFSEGVGTEVQYSTTQIIPEITFQTSLLPNNNYNYLLTQQDDTPLMILSANGISPSNTICFDANLI